MWHNTVLTILLFVISLNINAADTRTELATFAGGCFWCVEADFDKLFAINVKGVLWCAQAAAQQMIDQGGGKIITIGSMASIFGLPFAAPYAATKGGVVQLSRVLATAWAADNIQVNAYLPGWIETGQTANIPQQMPGLHEKITERCLMGRWGKGADFAGIGVFLASSASDSMLNQPMLASMA